jgi:hypothetical protein
MFTATVSSETLLSASEVILDGDSNSLERNVALFTEWFLVFWKECGTHSANSAVSHLRRLESLITVLLKL